MLARVFEGMIAQREVVEVGKRFVKSLSGEAREHMRETAELPGASKAWAGE